MDRLQALRDTANLPRAVAPTLCTASGGGAGAGGGGGGGGGVELRMNDSGLDMRMDDSLTDMQWLQKMDAGSEIPGFVQKAIKTKRPKSDKENQRPKDGSCRKKLDYGGESSKPRPTNKPPLSYASLIVLAISSTPQRMMTLSGIYRWIESTFPFYRTPESKAWKNSIRHNLSIRKNMFVKVYQFPPRRGNGSYWTLLSDGEDELNKAHPLFTTLLPPVIDEESIYCRVPLTHTIKSRGQFMPVLPHTTRKSPYFALQGSATPSNPGDGSSTIYQPQLHDFEAEATNNKTPKKRKCSTKSQSKISSYSSTPKHLTEHSYAKTVTFEPELQEVEEELAPEDLVESSFISDSEPFVERESKRQRVRLSDPCGSGGSNVESGLHNLQVGACDSTTDVCGAGSPRQCVTASDPDDMADCSLTSLLSSSFLTPMKTAAMMPDIALDAISFSPLYNFVTPQRGGTPPSSHTASRTTPSSSNTATATSTNTVAPPSSSSSSACSNSAVIATSEIAPVSTCMTTSPTSNSDNCAISDFDSGIFSPFASSLRFSTPLMKGVSPLVDLPGNVFNTPQSNEHSTPVRVVDSTSMNFPRASETTPTRKMGSRQLFSHPRPIPSTSDS